ncbi:MAG: hypothetical protein R3F11_00670 [Verrucomicrobiales bacterium]
MDVSVAAWVPVSGGTGGDVFRIDGVTGAVSLLATLPNHTMALTGSCNYCLQDVSFTGLGNLSYSQRHNKVYVTNLDDGKIYGIDATTGATLCTFDHGLMKPGIPQPDNATLVYTQKNRMVFGIEWHPFADRVYYAVRNALDQDEVWSVGLDANGCIVNATPCLEWVSQPYTALCV